MSREGLAVDHVLVAVADLDAAEQWWLRECGLGTVAGGDYRAIGLDTRVVPVGGTQYVELLTVLRPTPESADVQAVIDAGGGVFDWALATTDIDAVARRLRRPVEEGGVTAHDGTVAGWRVVANDAGSGLPFFIQYADAPSRVDLWRDRCSRAGHRRTPAGFASVATLASRERLDAWVGGASLAVVTDAAELAFGITFTDGTVVDFPPPPARNAGG